MERPRHDGGVETLAEEVAIARLVPLDARTLRGPALGDDGGDLALGDRVDEDQRLSPQPVEVLLDDAADEQRGHARVERVAALEENLEGGGSRQRVPGGQAGGAARHRRALGLERRGNEDGGQRDENDGRGDQAAPCMIQHLDPQ